MAIRIITAAIAVPLGILIIYLDNIWLYTVAMSFFSAASLFEIIRAIKCAEYKILTGMTMAFAASVPFLLNTDAKIYYYIVLFIFLVGLFSIQLNKHLTLKFHHAAMIGFSAMVIPYALNSLALLRYSENTQENGTFYLVFALIAAWVGDGGAYFVGTFIGKHKLCPLISPKKTIEGFFGGIIISGIFCGALSYGYEVLLNINGSSIEINWLLLSIIGVLCSALGVLGDLSASVIKREYGIKDFGNLLPGHGGIMDRFDSVLFVAPFLLLILQFINPITSI